MGVAKSRLQLLRTGFSLGGFSRRGLRAPGSNGSAAAAARPMTSPHTRTDPCFLHCQVSLNQGTTREARATRGCWVSQASLAWGSGETARARLTLLLSCIPGEHPGTGRGEGLRAAQDAWLNGPSSQLRVFCSRVGSQEAPGERSRQSRSSTQQPRGRGWGRGTEHGAPRKHVGPGLRRR